MKQIVLWIAFLSLAAYTCEAAIVIPTPNREINNRVYETTIEILAKCYMDASNAVGIIGDSDAFMKTLWPKYPIPVILIDDTIINNITVTDRNRRRLNVFVIIADNSGRFGSLLFNIISSIWWNPKATIFNVSPTPDNILSPTEVTKIVIAAAEYFVLDAKVIQFNEFRNKVVIFESNRFLPKAPKSWHLYASANISGTVFSLFAQVYRVGDQTCEALKFKKTTNLGKLRMTFFVSTPYVYWKLLNRSNSWDTLDVERVEKFDNVIIENFKWFIVNIAYAMNTRPAICLPGMTKYWDICVTPILYSDFLYGRSSASEIIFAFDQIPMYGLSQHTHHKSQLEKILSVIDYNSRIGMYLVYIVTFMFFKFFLRQGVVPAFLNIIRLTCNASLPTLPMNLAPSLYLASLFMFVVTLQGIYTGNLASLLTTTVAYPNVNTKEDIPKLGYTVYSPSNFYNKIAAEPLFEGRVVKLNSSESCIPYIMDDPLAVCALTDYAAATYATRLNLHVSREPIQSDYYYYRVHNNHPFAPRFQEIIVTWHECGLRKFNPKFDTFLNALVDDDEVKKNTFRRVMNLGDLSFAFVILGLGVVCSIVCFIVEILVSYISSRYAKRRNRVRPLLVLRAADKNVHGFRH